jgi:hypothetical protein
MTVVVQVFRLKLYRRSGVFETLEKTRFDVCVSEGDQQLFIDPFNDQMGGFK